MSVAARALLVALALAPASARAGGERPRIAILQAPSAAPASAAGAVARAAAEAVRQAGADAPSPEDVARAVLAAKGDLATCGATPACAAAVCAALQADALLVASVRDTGKFWLVELRVREGRGGWIKGHEVQAVDRDEGAARDAATRLAGRLVRQLVPAGAAPAPATAVAPVANPPPAAPPRQAQTGSAPVRPAPGIDTGASAPSRSTPAAIPPSARRGTFDERLTPHPETHPDPAPSSRRLWSHVFAGTGAALLAGGAAAGVLAWSESNGANAALARGDLGSFAAGRQSARTLGWTAAGLGGAGAAALAAGAWLRFGGRSSGVALELEPGLAGARVAVAF